MKKKLFENVGGNMFKLNENESKNIVDPNLVKDAMSKLPKCNPTKTGEGTLIATKSDGPKTGTSLYKLDNGNHAIKVYNRAVHSSGNHWVFETEEDKAQYEEKQNKLDGDFDTIFGKQ